MAADAPARALVIYGDGLASDLSDDRFSHIHKLAASGCCGFLALRSSSPENEAERVVTELAQLLDVQHNLMDKRAEGADSLIGIVQDKKTFLPSISERFMGMQAAMITNFGPAYRLGKQAGFCPFALQDFQIGANSSVEGFPNAAFMASSLLGMLDLIEPENKSFGKFELVLLHILGTHPDIEVTNQDEVSKPFETKSVENTLEWLDSLVGSLRAFLEPGSKASSHLYIVFLLGYGTTVQQKEFSPLHTVAGLSPQLLDICPKQSFMMKGGEDIKGIRKNNPLLVVHQMDSVTRRDDCKVYSLEEFQKSCGNLTILAERFLYEITFKLWRSPKYGA